MAEKACLMWIEDQNGEKRCIFKWQTWLNSPPSSLPLYNQQCSPHSNTLLLMGVILHVVSEESKDTMWFSPM